MKNKIYLSWEEFGDLTNQLIKKINQSKETFDGVYGIPRGGLPLAVCLSHSLNLPLLSLPTIDSLVVDDISDNGDTLNQFEYKKIACLYSTPWTKIKPDWYLEIKKNKNHWIVFPWENLDEKTNKNNL